MFGFRQVCQENPKVYTRYNQTGNMGQTTPADRRTIRSLRRHGFSRRSTATLTGWSRPTVRQYEPEEVEGHDESLTLDWSDVEPALPDDIDAEAVISPKFQPTDPDHDGGYAMPTELYDAGMSVNEALKERWALLNPESFMYLIFRDSPLISPPENFIEHICQRTERREKLPKPDLLAKDMNRLPGINKGEAQIFIREYKDIKDEYKDIAEPQSTTTTYHFS